MILAGDVGGTKVNLAVCAVQAGSKIVMRSQRRYPSTGFRGLSDILLKYFAETGEKTSEITAACFGVPGAVVEGKCQTVNLPWTLDQRELEQTLKLKPIRLINDVEATAIGIRTLEADRGLKTLRAGIARKGSQCLLAPGTGLGEALMIWDGEKHIISPSEGGHTEFGPQDEEQIELLKSLWPRHAHVSVEHVTSGPGIYRIYRFLAESGREQSPHDFEERLKAPGADQSKLISESAIREEYPICVRTLNLWLFFLGAEAGNIALKTLSLGGVFIGGGIVPQLLKLLDRSDGPFFKGLDSKGRMSNLVQGMPVHVITDDLTALYGAAVFGERLRGDLR